jgi:hypothetical protein
MIAATQNWTTPDNTERIVFTLEYVGRTAVGGITEYKTMMSPYDVDLISNWFDLEAFDESMFRYSTVIDGVSNHY